MIIIIYYDGLELTDNQYRIYIIKKYIVKTYGEDNLENIFTTYKSNLNKLAKILGKKDISFFCLYFLQDIFVVKDNNEARELSSGHYEMWDLANDLFINDIHDKVNIVMPRGYAKTTIFDLAVSIYLICYKKSRFILLGAKRDDDASQFIFTIKKVFKENQMIIDNFGELIQHKGYVVNATEIEFINDTYIRAIGSGSSARGLNFKGVRPTTVICDDFQDEKNILTDDAREKVYNKWTKEIEQVGDKAVYRKGIKIKNATKIICIGTVLHINCLISRLSRNKDYFTMLKRAIILEENQTIEDVFESDLWLKCKKKYFNDKDLNAKESARQFYLDNINEMKYPVLWEEKWNFFLDLAIPYWENRQAFMSELMNDANSIGEKWFKSILTQSKEEMKVQTFDKTMLCVDPASTTTKRADYTAMVVGSKSLNGFYYMRELVLDKFEFNQYCKKVVKILEKYDDITHIYIEKNTFQGTDVIKIKELLSQNNKLCRKNYTWINEMQRVNKDEKISTIVDDVNNGRIIFADDNKEFTDLILEFQGQRYSIHDDSCDITSECRNKLDKIEVIRPMIVTENYFFD